MIILTIEDDQKHNNTRKMYQTINQFQKEYQHKLKRVFYFLFIFIFCFFCLFLNKNIMLK